jgi:hypothetical protein
MQRQELTESDLARRASQRGGVTLSQSWVSRVARGEFKRPTERVRRLVTYAGIEMFEKGSVSELGEKRIQQALRSSWDGSLAQATIIANLIRATRGLH